MGELTGQPHTVNKNDNVPSSWVRMGEQSFNEACVPHIPLADWLIAKHCKKWWKNHPEKWDYQYNQFGICGTLWYPRNTKEWTARTLSIFLDCNPIELINDPETMLRIPALTPEIEAQVAQYIKTQEIK